MKEKLAPETLPAPKAYYSRGIKNGNMVYIAGTGAVDPATGTLFTGDVYTQTKMTIEAVKAVLAEAGGTLDDLVQLTVFLTDLGDYAEYNRAFDELFKPCVTTPPARATVQVVALAGGIKVEIMGVAILK